MEASRHPNSWPSPEPGIWASLGAQARRPARMPAFDEAGLARLGLMVGPVFDRLTAVEGPDPRTGATG